MKYFGSALSFSDINPNNSYGWHLQLKKKSLASFLISIFGVPHLGARIRHKILTKIIKTWKRKGSVLDVGCGFGLESLYLAEENFDLLGIDKSKEKIAIAKNLAKCQKKKNIEFKVFDILDDKVGLGEFDYIILFEVLEHVDKPNLMFRKISQYLKKGGLLVISSPAIHHFNDLSKEYLGHKYPGFNPIYLSQIAEANNLKIMKKFSFGNGILAKVIFFLDYVFLKYVPYFSALFFFISYPISVLDLNLTKSKNPLGYVFVFKKQ